MTDRNYKERQLNLSCEVELYMYFVILGCTLEKAFSWNVKMFIYKQSKVLANVGLDLHILAEKKKLCMCIICYN